MFISRRALIESAALSFAGAHNMPTRSGIDLFNAQLVLPKNASARIQLYARMFSEEAGKRCAAKWKPTGQTSIRLEVDNSKPGEGFTIAAENKEVVLTGHSERGLLYAIGHLLRNTYFAPEQAFIPHDRLNFSSEPEFTLRGHQLGYRPKTNSYDGWNVAEWEQYVRDLAVSGVNAIEILPPRTDDQPWSPHFPLPPEQMMVEMSRLADRYGLDLWMWYPALDNDYVNPRGVSAALREWAAVFEKLPRLDAVFTPGGDPGHTPPAILLDLLQKQKQNLRRSHPNAAMWVSPQSFNAAQLVEFFERANRADWLAGVVHGPQCRVSLPEMREKLRRDLPIRLYPDITHSLQCQFPVADWKLEFAFTEGRECINPRPQAFSAIARQYLPLSVGFISYSEGCNDDVNKFVWSSAAWSSRFDIKRCLLEYSSYFISSAHAPALAGMIEALEQNWADPKRTQDTLAAFRAIEKQAPAGMLANWRFQQLAYRAYYDAYSHGRRERFVDPAVRQRILELGEALFKSIHMQLDVEHYRAEAISRGANLDTLDANLFGPAESFSLPPGSFYDDLGDPLNRAHLFNAKADQPDPEFRHSVLIGFLYPDSLGAQYPVAWKRWGETLFDQPLEMRYENLDAAARYKVRIVYSGDAHNIKVRLAANGMEVHGLIAKPWPPKPLEFEIPAGAIRSRSLLLSWTGELGLGGGGRGCQISEVWLIRQ